MTTKQKIEFKWSENFNTGYIEIDGQHKKLFTLLSEFAVPIQWDLIKKLYAHCCLS